jgi:hypothetical protein
LRLLCDEDVGRSIPEALRALELGEVEYIRNLFRRRIRAGQFANGVKDEDWIPLAGRGGWLVFSCNRRLLDAQAQRDLWIREKVGGVFLTSGQEKRREVMWHEGPGPGGQASAEWSITGSIRHPSHRCPRLRSDCP